MRHRARPSTIVYTSLPTVIAGHITMSHLSRGIRRIAAQRLCRLKRLKPQPWHRHILLSQLIDRLPMRSSRGIIVLVVVVALSQLMVCCATHRRCNSTNDESAPPKHPEEFVPLHPPVIIPHPIEIPKQNAWVIQQEVIFTRYMALFYRHQRGHVLLFRFFY